jgi:predicted  nucleic acid-binding Zn-ribbon protein
MAIREIGASVTLDASTFKKEMSAVNSNLSGLQAEMKAVTAEFADNANSVEALTAKQKILDQAEAQQAEVETAKDKQEYYRGIIDDVVKDRDYYKQERDEVRERMDKMAHSFMDWRMQADNDRMDMKMQIAKLGRKVDVMVPFMCGDLTCKLRKRVVLSEDGIVNERKSKKSKEIEPVEPEAL